MILLTGCTGFVGSHLAEALVKHGLHVRCLVRNSHTIDSLTQEGMTNVSGDVMQYDSLVAATEGVDTVIHLVGIIREHGEATFERIHVEGTRNIIRAAQENGVRRFIYQSALGARERGVSEYQTTKWQAEQLTTESGMEWIVTRPSVLIGRGGEFVDTLVELVTRPPIIPIIGSGNYKLQPLWIEDLTEAFIMMLNDDEHWGKIYELGGPEQLTFNRMIVLTCRVLGIRKPIIHLPEWLMRPIVRVLESIHANTPITSDQLAMLAEDSVTNCNTLTEVFGITPLSYRTALQRSLGR
ncbi:MAG TPA: complex I NDUFA9 subunit family protein, partial [Armatimonadota bacterium]